MTASTVARDDLAVAPPERRELYCAECGFGIMARQELPACPMCRRHDWHERRVVGRRAADFGLVAAFDAPTRF